MLVNGSFSQSKAKQALMVNKRKIDEFLGSPLSRDMKSLPVFYRRGYRGIVRVAARPTDFGKVTIFFFKMAILGQILSKN